MAIDFNRVPRYIRREMEKGAKPIKSPEKGRRSKQVQEWQRYHECRTSIDGAFCPATASSVRDFQRKKRLRVTGIVDNMTWEALVAPMRDALREPTGISRLSPERTVR